MRVLMADDDESYLDTLRRMVCGWGHAVQPITTGTAALTKVSAERFDLLLLDVFLPDMTAMELIPALGAIAPDLPVITMTGQSSRELERELRGLGIAYYMSKPFPKGELYFILEHMAGRSRVPGRSRTKNAIINPT